MSKFFGDLTLLTPKKRRIFDFDTDSAKIDTAELIDIHPFEVRCQRCQEFWKIIVEIE